MATRMRQPSRIPTMSPLTRQAFLRSPPAAENQDDRDERTRYFDEAEEHTPYLAATAGGVLFLVKTEDKHMGRSLFAKRGRGEHLVLARAVGSITGLCGPDAIAGTEFVDVGANIGTTTIPALVSHGFASAVAIEPEPENLRVLRLNVVLNDIQDRVRALPVAVSNQPGHSSLVVHQARGGKHWIATDESKLSRKKVEPEDVMMVETVTLDYLVDGGVIAPRRTGLLWMDAEAHEGHILEGASSLLEHGPPLVLEFNPAHLDRAGDRELLQRALEDSYTHFVGMHREHDRAEGDFPLRPVAELPAFAENFLGKDRRSGKTDILVLRLERDKAEGLRDLDAVIKAHAVEEAPHAVEEAVPRRRTPRAGSAVSAAASCDADHPRPVRDRTGSLLVGNRALFGRLPLARLAPARRGASSAPLGLGAPLTLRPRLALRPSLALGASLGPGPLAAAALATRRLLLGVAFRRGLDRDRGRLHRLAVPLHGLELLFDREQAGTEVEHLLGDPGVHLADRGVEPVVRRAGIWIGCISHGRNPRAI